jgi:hypothetical protein
MIPKEKSLKTHFLFVIGSQMHLNVMNITQMCLKNFSVFEPDMVAIFGLGFLRHSKTNLTKSYSVMSYIAGR